jgi:predicted metal-dependent phosphoesterase TrpH
LLIDLHVHSNCSDGDFSPEALIDVAAREKIGALALCDHDTTSGNDRFAACATLKGIAAIRGIELSADWKNGICHILGLGITGEDGRLKGVLEQIRESRGSRNEKIIDRLVSFGNKISLDEVRAIADGGVIGRPHIARILVDKGYATSIRNAFDCWLAKGKPAYVDRYHLSPEDAVSLLKETGALVVLAHPSQLRLGADAVNDLVKKLAENGLGGIEVYTPYTPPEDLCVYSAIADRYALAVSGGSDFHGALKPSHHLGYYNTDKEIPERCFYDVLRKITKQDPQR